MRHASGTTYLSDKHTGGPWLPPKTFTPELAQGVIEERDTGNKMVETETTSDGN